MCNVCSYMQYMRNVVTVNLFCTQQLWKHVLLYCIT